MYNRKSTSMPQTSKNGNDRTNPCTARCKNAGFPGSRGSLLKALKAAYCKLLRIMD